MAHSYCGKCRNALIAPTLREILADEWECHSCHEPLVVDKYMVSEAMGELIDRLELAEREITELQNNQGL